MTLVVFGFPQKLSYKSQFTIGQKNSLDKRPLYNIIVTSQTLEFRMEYTGMLY